MQTEEVTFTLPTETESALRIYCFVCTGNTCRSPMAAALLNHYGASHGVCAISRGIAAEVGAPMSANAVKALTDAGIPASPRNDYEHHRAKQISEADLINCESIFAISPRHAQALMMAFPAYAGKIHVLGDITDPYGGDEKVYKACLRDIRTALHGLFPTLVPQDEA